MAKIIGNTVGVPNPQTDWSQTDETKGDYLKNRDVLIELIKNSGINDLGVYTVDFLEPPNEDEFEIYVNEEDQYRKALDVTEPGIYKITRRLIKRFKNEEQEIKISRTQEETGLILIHKGIDSNGRDYVNQIYIGQWEPEVFGFEIFVDVNTDNYGINVVPYNRYYWYNPTSKEYVWTWWATNCVDIIDEDSNEFGYTTPYAVINYVKDKLEGLSSNDFTDDYMMMVEENSFHIGNMVELLTDNTDSLVGAINEIYDDIHSSPVEVVPDVLSPNKEYNLGIVDNLHLTFPSVANDGDVIYISFFAEASDGNSLNLVIDTTNTSDIELIPENATGYEIYAKYIKDNLGTFLGDYWVVNYSEYTKVG
jgi:hypothetical protein